MTCSGRPERSTGKARSGQEQLRCKQLKVLSVKQLVALLENNESCVAELVLLANIAHIEEFLVVEDESLSESEEVEKSEHRSEGPHDESLSHNHSSHAGTESNGSGIGQGSHLDIIPVLSSGNECPILLNIGIVVAVVLN